MTDDTQMVEALEARVRRREGRRDFFRAMGAAAAIGGGLALTSCGGNDDDGATPTPSPTATGTATPTPTPTATSSSGLTDGDLLNFALNLEYLEAQFYAYAAGGAGLDSTLLTGPSGTTPGAVTGGRQVSFSDPVIANFAREIAADERAHVQFLRAAIGATAVAMPAIDISATATSAFSNAARAAGLIGAGEAFDPYANDNNFLLAAYIFEDVGVTAYKGAAAQLSSAVVLQAAAGILATEAYHAAMIRTALYTKGLTTPSLIDATEKISDARDSLDGSTDLDQGIRAINGVSNIAPLDANGIAFGRTPQQVLNIVYLNKASVSLGGFFPAGVNGTVKTSAAN